MDSLKQKALQHPQAGLLLLAFVILALLYTLATPPLEAGDESRHYAVVKYMAETGRLPVQNVLETSHLQRHWSHEGNQPPLYYALAAVLTAWIETGSWDEVFWYNPHTTIGNPLRPDNKNITLHPPGQPWRGHVLAVQLIRLLSIAMAAVTVTLVYAIALALFHGRRWLAAGAMAVAAFNPMFIFISASVNNDNAVIMFVTLALWLMVRLLQAGRFPPHRSTALLGLLIGLGALSKLYAVGLLPLAALLFLWLAYQPSPAALSTQPAARSTPPIVHYLLRITPSILLLFLLFLAVAGWFYWRNASLYEGDFLALRIMRETAGQRAETPSLATLWAEFEGFRIAYWGLFGGVNILADRWIYTVLDAVSLVALLGLLVFIGKLAVDQKEEVISLPVFSLLLGWGLIMLAGFIVWNLTQPAGQGRLFYPAVASFSGLGMLGLTWWLPVPAQKWGAGLAGGGLFLFATLAPFLYIAPAYALPPRLAEADLPPALIPVDFTYDGAVRLIGYQVTQEVVRPAETVSITLYWQLLRPAPLDYSLFIHLLGRQRQVIGQIDSYPGGGKWPATRLQPGDILADHYEVPVAPEAEFQHAPVQLRLAAGVYDFHEPGRPGRPAVNAQGQPVDPIIGHLKLVPWQQPTPPRLETPVNFFDKVHLLSYELTDTQSMLTLNWEVLSPFEADYTVFIQAWDSQTGKYAAGFDGPPVGGDYPTSLWAPGEIIVDQHPLDLSRLAPGQYRLLVGLYNPITAKRLPAFGPTGPLPDYAVEVATLQIGNGE